MTALFILHHLSAYLVVASLLLVAVVAYGVGARQHDNRPNMPRWTSPAILIDWANDIPVAIITDPATAADVAAWLDAVREGAVLRV